MATHDRPTGGSPIRAAELAILFASPKLYISDMQWQAGTATVHRMSRATYSDSVFLDHRTRSTDDAAHDVPVRIVMEAYRGADRPRRSLAAIQHTALCGSTLLCRCLDFPGKCLPYKEPYLLHNLSGIWRIGARRKLQAQLPYPDTPILDVALAMLSRTYRPEEKPLIKLSDSCVSLCPSLLQHHANARLLLMYHRLPRFLVAMLRTPERRAYVRNMLVRAHVDLAQCGKRALVTREFDTDGRAAAYVWLALMYPYLRLLVDAPDRVRSLDATDFFDTPAQTLRSVSNFLELGLSDADIDGRIGEGVLDRDSKASDQDFDNGRYRRDLDKSAAVLAVEIDDAIDWVTNLSADEPIPSRLPHAV